MEWADQRLGGQEPDTGGNCFQVLQSPERFVVLYTRTDPDVWRPPERCCHLLDPDWSLRQHLERVLTAGIHDAKDTLNELCRNVRMEEVTHGVHEYQARPAPVHGEVDQIVVERNSETSRIPGLPHRLKPTRKSFGVAVLAPTADLRAAGDRVPGCVRPFDECAISHSAHSRPAAVRKRCELWHVRALFAAESRPGSADRAGHLPGDARASAVQPPIAAFHTNAVAISSGHLPRTPLRSARLLPLRSGVLTFVSTTETSPRLATRAADLCRNQGTV